jgi:hypothetical protein
MEGIEKLGKMEGKIEKLGIMEKLEIRETKFF